MNDRKTGAHDALNESDRECDAGEQIAGHDAERCVGEPRSGDNQSEQYGGAIEGATPEGALRVAVAEDEQQEQWNPETAGEFAECGALVGGEHGVAGEECGASGEGCGSVRQVSDAPEGVWPDR